MTTSTKAAHTPGPWTLTKANAKFTVAHVLRDSNGAAIAQIDPFALAGGSEIAAANARLIAAAPEMLEALEQFECPDCNHLLKYHIDEYGCEVDRGDRPGNEGAPAEAMGPCGCNANYGPGLDPKFFAPELRAIAAIRKARGGQ